MRIRNKRRVLGLVGALIAFFTMSVMTALQSSASTIVRQPATGSYECGGGSPMAFYHESYVINGTTNHRIAAWYFGDAVTNPSTTDNHNDFTQLTEREQYWNGSAYVSLGGIDYQPGGIFTGVHEDPTNTTDSPGHAGATYIAFAFHFTRGIYTYSASCRLQL